MCCPPKPTLTLHKTHTHTHTQNGTQSTAHLTLVGELGHLHVQGCHLVPRLIQLPIQLCQSQLHCVVLCFDALVVTLKGLILSPQLLVG